MHPSNLCTIATLDLNLSTQRNKQTSSVFLDEPPKQGGESDPPSYTTAAAAAAAAEKDEEEEEEEGGGLQREFGKEQEGGGGGGGRARKVSSVQTGISLVFFLAFLPAARPPGPRTVRVVVLVVMWEGEQFAQAQHGCLATVRIIFQLHKFTPGWNPQLNQFLST